MLDFGDGDEKAKQVMLHYAEKLSNDYVYNIVNSNGNVKNQEEARKLAVFYWQMLDKSAEDRESGEIILGEKNLQYWMERLLNIVSGYLERSGYEKEWEKASDEA